MWFKEANLFLYNTYVWDIILQETYFSVSSFPWDPVYLFYALKIIMVRQVRRLCLLPRYAGHENSGEHLLCPQAAWGGKIQIPCLFCGVWVKTISSLSRMSRQETPAAGGSFQWQWWHNTKEEGLCWSWVGLVPLFSGLWLGKGSWWKERAAHLSADREAEREREGCRGEKRGMVRGGIGREQGQDTS